MVVACVATAFVWRFRSLDPVEVVGEDMAVAIGMEEEAAGMVADLTVVVVDMEAEEMIPIAIDPQGRELIL